MLDGTRLAGVLSERDVMGRVVARGLDPDATRVGDVMTRDLIVGETADSPEEGPRKMKQGACRHLPVVDAGRLVGMLSLRDLMQAWATLLPYAKPPPGR